MKVIQGFVVVHQLANNSYGVVAPIGELSTEGRTYAKEKGEYFNATFPEYNLVTFRSFESDDDTQQQVTNPELTEIFTLVRAMMSYANATTRPFTLQEMLQGVSVIVGSDYLNLVFGPLVQTQNLDFPQFASWISRNNASAEIKVWFSDAAFTSQFTGYETTVVPPIPNVNDLMLAYADAKALLDAVSVSQLMNTIQEARERNPYTVARMPELAYVNRHDPSQSTKTVFGVMTYGAEGDVEDVMKDAIVDYLISNSNYGEEQWQLVFPELFVRTEMIFIPRWDLLALENLTERASMFRSTIPSVAGLNFVKTMLSNFSASYVDAAAENFMSNFRLLSGHMVGGSRNPVGKKVFSEAYPDYLAVSSTSVDFARMSLPTQEMVLMLQNLINIAEKATRFSTLETGYRRIIRNEKVYISRLHNGITFMVAAASNTDYQ